MAQDLKWSKHQSLNRPNRATDGLKQKKKQFCPCVLGHLYFLIFSIQSQKHWFETCIFTVHTFANDVYM